MSVTPPLEPSGTNTNSCCEVGDITVTKIYTGYLIGRVIPQIGPGPWWEFIAIVRTFTDASHHAVTIARRDGVRAWLHKSGDDYELLGNEGF